MQMIKYNKGKHNHAYKYRYSNINKFNSQWSNKIYSRDYDG
jgi:hypothetical protein